MFNPLIPTNISKLRSLSAKADENTINMTIGNPIEAFPPELEKTLSQQLAFSLSYTTNNGHEKLRSALAQQHQFKKENYVITAGAQGALAGTLMALLGPNDLVVLPNPGFLAYPTLVQMFHGRVSYYEYSWGKGKFELSVEGLIQQIPEDAKCIIINNPSNPTCHQFSNEELAQLAAWAEKNQKFLLLDEVYGELNYQSDFKPSLYINDYTVSTSSVSKSHALTGLRLGWAYTNNQDLVKKITVVNQYQATCASTLSQAIVYELYRNKALFRGILERYREVYQQKLALFFDDISFIERPQCGFYAFCPVPKKFENKSEKFAQELLNNHNLLVVPGEYFGSAGKNFIRLSLSTSDENIRFCQEKYLNYFT